MSQFPTEFYQPQDITQLKPRELLKLKEINGIPVEKLNRLLKPNRSYIRQLFKEYAELYSIQPDEDLISQCTPQEELEEIYPSIIDNGLIGPHDNIQILLALQRDFVDKILNNVANPHQIIGGEIEKILDEVEKLPYGAGTIDFHGLKTDRKLVSERWTTPWPAKSPFGDGDKSNISVRIYDVTDTPKIEGHILENSPTILLSGLHEKFAKLYGFYEESEPFLEHEDCFHKGKTVILGNLYTFLPEGLHILGISDKPLNKLRESYKETQKKFKRH